jgi:ribosomal protein S18 acetylase RimI-like enzyme
VSATFNPIESVDEGIILRCAQLMMSSTPWSKLSFTLEECLESLLPNQSIRVFAQMAFDEVVAFMAVLPGGFAEEPMVEYLCVAEEARGNGLGTAFMEYFEGTLYPDAINYYLLVSDINVGAKRLYERLGYRQVGLLEDFNLPRQQEIIMRKTKGPRHPK